MIDYCGGVTRERYALLLDGAGRLRVRADDAVDAGVLVVIVAAFAAPENGGKAVVSIAGRMVEKLHADQAGRLLAKVDLINERKTKA